MNAWSIEMLVLCKEPDRLEVDESSPWTGGLPPGAPHVPQPIVGMRALLQLVALDARVRSGGVGPKANERFNARLLDALKVVYQVSTSRSQLNHLLGVQSSLECWMHLAQARNENMQVQDRRKLEQHMVEVRRAVGMAGEAWSLAGSAFTRLTRLLPVHLAVEELHFQPMECAEMKSLERICAVMSADRREPVPFSGERVRYEKAVAEVAGATARAARAGRALREAEDGFRVGARDALELTSALVRYNQQRREVMQKTMRACMARDALYALAQRLPEQLQLR